MIDTIALIGFMGSGKTTVGKGIEQFYPQYHFRDSDEEIEKLNGTTISEIFATQGEAAFRSMEYKYLEELFNDKTKGKTILSTGGGMAVNENCGKILKENAFVVYLYASVQELYERLKNDTNRPLLQVPDRMAVIKEMYDRRNPIYESVATCKVNTFGRTVEEVCDEIIGTYNMFLESVN